MKYTHNAINVLTARTFKGIGRAWFIKNWQPNLTDETIVRLINNSHKGEDAVSVVEFECKRNVIEKIIAQAEDSIDGIVAIGDIDFPAYRGDVKNSERPIFLFYKGDLSLLDARNTNVAVIGLLTPTPYIEQRERSVVAKLIEKKATIVSGLALGCDTIAHRTALEYMGKTIAILPSPLMSVMPASNRILAQQILEHGGLLISEYLTDAKSRMELSGRYQERDRLQALFSDAIILSASYVKNDNGLDSGSRLAMNYALDYGIPRGVIYDETDADDPMYGLNRQYITNDVNVVTIRSLSIIQDVDVLMRQKVRKIAQQYVQKMIF